MESGYKIPTQPKMIAYLIDKKISGDKLCEIIKQAQEKREQGVSVLVKRMNKNKKFQKQKLTEEGYEEFVEFFND